MTAAIPMISLGLGLGGSAMSAYGQYKAGQAEKAANERNAQIVLEQMEEEQASSEASFSRLMGKQRSAYAKAGVDISSGSPLLVYYNTAMREAEEQKKLKRSGTEQAEMLRKYGRNAATAGTVSAATGFLSSLAQTGLQAWQMGAA